MKKISIIGAAGNMGSNIARNLAKAGYSINLTDNSAEKIASLQNKLSKLGTGGIKAYTNLPDAINDSEVVILAVWHSVQNQIASAIKNYVNEKIVISIANPLNEYYNGLTTDPATSSAEELAKLLPKAKIVKAFNSTFAGDFENTILDGKQIDSFIAGDDEDAVKEVAEIVKAVGFNPLIAGKLSVSRILENMSVLLIGLSQRYEYNWVAGWKVLSKVA